MRQPRASICRDCHDDPSNYLHACARVVRIRYTYTSIAVALSDMIFIHKTYTCTVQGKRPNCAQQVQLA